MVTSENFLSLFISLSLVSKLIKSKYPKIKPINAITGRVQKIIDEESIVSNSPIVMGSNAFNPLLNSSLYLRS